MSEKYKVLSGILALRQFTTEELAERTGVKLGTVNTVISREKWRWLDLVEIKETKTRGGQPKVYRLKPDQAPLLQKELEQLYPVLLTAKASFGVTRNRTNFAFEFGADMPAPDIAINFSGDFTLPFGLEMVKDLLLNDHPKAESPIKQQEILELAQVYLDGIRDEIQLIFPNGGLGEKLIEYVKYLERFLKSMQSLAKVEMEAEKGMKLAAKAGRGISSRDSGSFSRIRDLVEQISNNLSSVAPALAEELPQLFFSPSPVRLYLDKNPLGVLLIDAIETSADFLTDYVTDVLRERGIEIRFAPSVDLPNEFEQLIKNSPIPEICLLTVNSESNPDSVRVLCEKVMDAWEPKDNVYILDQNSDPHIRNMIAKNNVHYVNYANQLEPQAMLGELNLLEFE